jgi:Skp family chaperone for outer membrane proteins
MKQMHHSFLLALPIVALVWWQTQQPASPAATQMNVPMAKVAIIDSNEFAADKGILQVLQQLRILDEKYKPQTDELQKMQKDIEALQEEIRTKSANWTIEVQRRKQEDLEDKQLKIKRRSEDAQRSYQKERLRMTAPISERVRTHLQQYASKRGITVLIDIAPLNQSGAIPYYDQATNITQDFINEYNKAYPVTQAAGTK